MGLKDILLSVLVFLRFIFWGFNLVRIDDFCVFERVLFFFLEIEIYCRYRLGVYRFRKKCIFGIIWYLLLVDKLFNRILLMSGRRVSVFKVSVVIVCF